MNEDTERAGSVRRRVPWLVAGAVLVLALGLAAGFAVWASRGKGRGTSAGVAPTSAEASPAEPRQPPKVATRIPPPPKPPEPPKPTPTDPSVLLDESFAGPALSSPPWVLTRDGDFKEAVADVVEGRLRLRAGTIGTRDDTVKHLGIRTAEALVDFSSPVEVGCEFDWNKQANGCYLRASLYLCPTATEKTAAAERDWLCFQYVGVPPGKNARASLARRKAAQLRFLYTEGWPDKQRTGRPVGREKVVLRLGPDTAELIENGKTLWGPAPHGLSFRRAWLYLELSSHSNYPPRELFLDNVTVRRVPAVSP